MKYLLYIDPEARGGRDDETLVDIAREQAENLRVGDEIEVRTTRMLPVGWEGVLIRDFPYPARIKRFHLGGITA